MDDIVFNVLLLKGESGNNILNITKTGTSGLVDTYTVTLTDGSTTTYEVTNGSNIQSITKTGTSGLVDTYTVTLTDGSTTTFNVTNGSNGSNANLADVEPTQIATQSYTVGEHLIYNENYYVATQSISIGDTLVEGTNIEKRKVGDEIEDIEGDLTTKQNASDNSLNTTDKTVVGAINEVKTTVDAINNHLKHSDTASGSDFPTAIQNIVTQALQSKNPSENDIIDIVGSISRTELALTSVFYSSLGCKLNSSNRLSVVGFATTSENMYRVVAVAGLSGWGSVTVTVTEV